MNIYLTQLVELVEIDKKIDSFEPKIEAIKQELNEKVQAKDEIINKIEANKEILENNELTISKNEQHLQELSDKLKDLSKKSASVKTEKEMKALQLEEEIAKEQINFANEEIERLQNAKDQIEAEIKELEEESLNIQKEIDELNSNTQKELEVLEKDRMKVYENRQKLLADMNQNVIIFYEKIRRWAGNTTVVAVKKQACYGCYMKLNDHTYAKVLAGEEITTCPHCGRILYKEITSQEQEDTQEEASA